jgi:two-component system, cell cycle response regulator DivK
MNAQPSVLLVADSDDEQEFYTESFQRHGFTTLQARSADEAFRLAFEMEPSAIVTDVELAGRADGLELTRWLKGDDRMRRLPVVRLTG